MSDFKEYKPMEAEYNVQAAVDNLKDAIEEYKDFAECETETARVLRNIGNEKDAKYYEETAENDKKIVAWLTELQERREADRWISIKERMPNEEDYHDCYGFPDGVVMWQTDNGDMGFGWYYHSTKCWSDTNDIPIKSGKVIAWKPLPKPYESEVTK